MLRLFKAMRIYILFPLPFLTSDLYLLSLSLPLPLPYALSPKL